MKAMVFAAGEGRRLRPLTLSRPKALVEVAGEPMLGRVLRNLARAGVSTAVVNVSYLGEQIIDYLRANDFGLETIVADERSRLLETGGGLLAARRLLEGSEPILLHNADLCTDLDLSRLQLRGDATLLVSERRSSRKLIFNPDDMRLEGWINEATGETRGETSGRRRAFNAIHVVSPSIFEALDEYSRSIGSDKFSLTPFYVAMARKLEIYGCELSGYRWHDVGDTDKLNATNSDFGQ